MSAVEPTPTDQPASEFEDTDAPHAGMIKTPYGYRFHKPVTVPGLVGPTFPFPPSVDRFFRRLFQRKSTPDAR